MDEETILKKGEEIYLLLLLFLNYEQEFVAEQT